MDQAQREFLVELEELVELIFVDLDELRLSLTDGHERRESRELIDQVFRRVHSVKGSAASSGLAPVSEIAHQFENLLDAVRCGRTLLTEEMLDTCGLATEALAESLSQAASEAAASNRDALFDQLRSAAKQTGSNAETDREAILSRIPPEIWQSLTEAEKHRLVSVVEEETPLFLIATSFDLGNFDEEFFRLKGRLVESGEVISTSPTVDDTNSSKINFRVLYASGVETSILQANVSEFSEVLFNRLQSTGDTLSSTEDGRSEPLASVSSLANFVRTDLGKLDQLISSTHELLRTTSNALSFALSQVELSADARAELQGLDVQLKKSFMSVEDDLISLRMISLGPTLQRVLRAGRMAARLGRKEVDFEVTGANIQLDKLLVDAIADPLIHLVRNAVDHGIEDTEARVRSGKKLRGTVRIEALSEGSQSRIRVTDDGRGIDPLLIAKAATRLEIVTESDFDFAQSLRLIFRPGFSTRELASEVSGRGVGLDVVETAVEQVGGELRVSSKPTAGTTFEIRLPVTFGLLQATVFVSGANRYCVPASQTPATRTGHDEVTQPAPREVSGAAQADETTSSLFVCMRELLGQPAETDERQSNQPFQLITCEFSDEGSGSETNGTKRVIVRVDAIEGNEEVLVRGLGRHAGRWYGVAGATELRDGTVALVLDLPRLLAGSEL